MLGEIQARPKLKKVQDSAPSERPPPPAVGMGGMLAAIQGGVKLRKVDPSEPQPAAKPSGGGGGGLMAELQRGVKLKKTAVADRPKKVENPLMAAIKGGRKHLKRVAEEETAEPAAAKQSMGMFKGDAVKKMLEIRKAVDDSDSESDDDDAWDEDNDE